MNVNPARVRQFIFDHFDDDELTKLCFDHYPEVYRDSTSGQTKQNKVIRLVSYCLDRERIPELMAILAGERSDPYGRVFGHSAAELKQKTNLNTADLAELESIPQIGPSLAARIVEGRPYDSIESLSRIKGIGPARLLILRNFCLV